MKLLIMMHYLGCPIADLVECAPHVQNVFVSRSRFDFTLASDACRHRSPSPFPTTLIQTHKVWVALAKFRHKSDLFRFRQSLVMIGVTQDVNSPATQPQPLPLGTFSLCKLCYIVQFRLSDIGASYPDAKSALYAWERSHDHSFN